MRLVVVDDAALELGGEDVADDAHREIGLLEHHRRGRRLLVPLLNDLVELVEVAHLPLEVLALRPLRGGTDDRPALAQVEPLRLLAQPVALLVAEPPGDADALAVGHVHEVAARDRELHRQACALRLQRVLDDLDDDLVARLEHLGDALAL
jgi:hypothetical protein